jgi:membrane protein implicated in regulation of membrane protease activity
MTLRDPTPASGPVAGQVIALAKAELKQEALRAGRPWGMLGGAGFAGYMVLLFASIAAWWGFAEVMAPGWAALIVTAIWAVIGVVLYTQGRRRLREVNLKPDRTVRTVSDMPDTASAAAGQAQSAASDATGQVRRAGRQLRD